MFRKFSIFLLILGALVVLAAQPAFAQGGAVWNGQYYNNAFLADPIVLTRADGSISFNWGTGSPGSGINSDNFSARWGSDVYFQAGTYRFWVLADDNIRVILDYGVPLIDTFSSPAVGQVVSVDVALSAGNHHIQVDYREAGGDAYAYFTWANLATNPSGPNFPGIGQQPPSSVVGQWTAQYYSNVNLAGSPSVTQIESSPTHNWGYNAPVPGVPADDFSVRWTSQQSLNAGTYRINVKADDGFRVYVNGALVLNEWHDAINRTYSADVNLPAGQHTFVVEYYEATNLAFMDYSLQLVGGGGGSQPPVVYTPPPVNTGGAWLAYYFNNRDLAGNPVAILSESSPSHNWGAGSPLASVSGDNFSARWISTQNLNAGAYRITVRADDGVRVYVNGALVINEWHNASGQTYVADVNLSTAQHTFAVEFYEAGGDALLDFNLAAGGGSSQPTNPPVNTGATASVTAYRLNVRNQPSTASSATVLTKINQGETYPVVGRTTDRSWWQINVNGTVGWVYGRFVNVSTAGNVPVTTGGNDGTSQGFPTGYNVTASTSVNIRSGPGTSNAILGVLRQGRTAQLLGRNASGTWWQVNYNGIVGWVSAVFATLEPGSDIDRISITG